MKIVSIIGTRPHYIKHSVFSKELKVNSIDEIVINTGQHYDDNMSKDFLKEFNLNKPDYNLDIGSLSHAKQTAQMMIGIEEILIKEKPNYAVVFGDTNTTLAGALSAVKLHIKLVHVESGIRSFNRNMPEEINRIVVDNISDLLFAPTEIATDNIKDLNVYNTGDITYDSYLNVNKDNKPGLKYYLATVHRPSNTDNKESFKSIIDAFEVLAYPVLFPVHPRIKKMTEGLNLLNVKFIDPVGYIEMINLINSCEKVLTDSGGMQKEAYFMNKPCITLRNDTEYPETLEGNKNILAGSDSMKILEAMNKPVTNNYDLSIFGDGKSAEKMVKIIMNDCR